MTDQNKAAENVAAAVIKPTVGRVVLYRPPEEDRDDIRHAATVAMVHNDTHVNLAVVDSNGVPYNKQSVVLCQGDEVCEKGECEWMAYQKELSKANADYVDNTLADDMAQGDSEAVNLEDDADATGITDFDEDVINITKAVIAKLDEYKADNDVHVSPELMSEEKMQKCIATTVFIAEKPGVRPEALHNRWVDQMFSDGWNTGEEDNLDAKIRADLVPFDQLSEFDQGRYVVCLESVLESLGLKAPVEDPDDDNSGDDGGDSGEGVGSSGE